jgi:hypothetical protein
MSAALASQPLDWFADTEVLVPIVLYICEVVYRQYYTADPTSLPGSWKKKWSKVIFKLQIEWGFTVDRLSLKHKTGFIEQRIKYKNGEETRINPLTLRRKLNEKYPHTRAIVDDAMGVNVIGRTGHSTPHEQSVIRNLQSIRQLVEILVEHFIHGPRSEVQDSLRTLQNEVDSAIRDGGDESGDASNDDSDYDNEADDDDAIVDNDELLPEPELDLTMCDPIDSNTVSLAPPQSSAQHPNVISPVSPSSPSSPMPASPCVSSSVASSPMASSSSSSSSSSSTSTSSSSRSIAATSARTGLANENAKKAALKAAEVAAKRAAVAAAKAANPKSIAPKISADGRSLVNAVQSKTKALKRVRIE